jgi:hypothetical protein
MCIKGCNPHSACTSITAIVPPKKPLGLFLTEIIEVIIKAVMIDFGLSLRPKKEGKK